MKQMGGKPTLKLGKGSSQTCWVVLLFIHEVRFVAPDHKGCLQEGCLGSERDCPMEPGVQQFQSPTPDMP